MGSNPSPLAKLLDNLRPRYGEVASLGFYACEGGSVMVEAYLDDGKPPIISYLDATPELMDEMRGSIRTASGRLFVAVNDEEAGDAS